MAAPLILAALAGIGADQYTTRRARRRDESERMRQAASVMEAEGLESPLIVGPQTARNETIIDLLTSENAAEREVGRAQAGEYNPAAIYQRYQDRQLSMQERGLGIAQKVQDLEKGDVDLSKGRQDLAKGSVELANLVAAAPRTIIDPYTIDTPQPLQIQVPGRGTQGWREHNEQMLVYNDMLQAATQYQEMLETMGTEIFNPRNKSMLESARMQLQMLKRSAEKLGTWDEGTATLLNQWLDDPTSLWNNIISGTGLGAGAMWNSEYFKGQMDYIREVATRQAISHHRLMPNTDINYNFLSERVIPVGPYRDVMKARLAETQRAAQ